jgi:hypothetical protein
VSDWKEPETYTEKNSKNLAFDDWGGEFFRLKGWHSKKQAQAQLRAEILPEITKQLERLREERRPPEPKATLLANDKSLKAGKEFQAYTSALAEYEKLPAPTPRPVRPTPPVRPVMTTGNEKTDGETLSPITETKAYKEWAIADQDWVNQDAEWRNGVKQRQEVTSRLRAACQGYLDHFAKHDEKQQRQEQNIRKRDHCQDTLKALDDEKALESKAAVLTKMLTLPWDGETQMQASTIKAELDFHSLDGEGGEEVEAPPLNQVEQLGNPGVNNSFWVNKKGENGKAKSFIFKPSEKTSPDELVPEYGQAPREVMAGRVADVLNGMLGIDLGMPETQLINVKKERFPKPKSRKIGFQPPKGENVLGSLQQFAPTNGKLVEQSWAVRAAVPPECCQDMCVFDTITGNLDRHSGNFLVTGDEQTAKLVPIDHGLTFPENGNNLYRLGPAQNSLISLPGSHEKFSDDMIEKIRNIDPETLKASLQNEIKTVNAVHEQTSGVLTDKALDCARQRMIFMQMACDQLTPAALQTAIANNALILFPDPLLEDKKFREVAEKVIEEAAQTQDMLKQFYGLQPEELRILEKQLDRDGWGMINANRSNIVRNKVFLLAALAHGLQSPKVTVPLGEGEVDPKVEEAMRQVFPAARSPSEIPRWEALTAELGTSVPGEVISKLTSIYSDLAWSDKEQKNSFQGSTAKSPLSVLVVVKEHRLIQQAVAQGPQALKQALDTRMLDLKFAAITHALGMMASSEKTDFAQLAEQSRQQDDLPALSDLLTKITQLVVGEMQQQITEIRGNLEAVRKELNEGTLQERDGITKITVEDMLNLCIFVESKLTLRDLDMALEQKNKLTLIYTRAFQPSDK